jgi:hypothetical protein
MRDVVEPSTPPIDGIKKTQCSRHLLLLSPLLPHPPPRLKLTQYRPTRLDKLVFHSDIGEALQKLVTESGLGRKG